MMARSASSVFQRRLLIASVIFGALVVALLLIFGWTIFRTLSQQELDRVLLETREEAQELARQLASRAEDAADDLYLVMTLETGADASALDDLAREELVHSLAIYRRDGTLVWASGSRPEQGGGDGLPGDILQEAPGSSVPREGSRELPGATLGDDYQLDEAIGELGYLRVHLSREQLQQRVGQLRGRLLREMRWLLVVSLAVLGAGYVIVWLLMMRARRAEEKAAEADRMAYIGTLAAGLAHEIRNPLNSLNLNMQMLEEEIATDRQIRDGQRLLGITRQEISRLERLVTDFLLYARPRELEMEELPPAVLLEETREVLAGELKVRGARVEIRDAAGGALVKVDPAQLRQLLLNLTGNALNATEESGRPPRITLAAELEGNRVVLSVRDNGIGIPEEELGKIFDVFYSTRKGGTGLGLAVVQRIAHGHGGSLEVESVPGEGTEVRLSLPLAAMEQEPSLDGRPALSRAEA